MKKFNYVLIPVLIIIILFQYCSNDKLKSKTLELELKSQESTIIVNEDSSVTIKNDFLELKNKRQLLKIKSKDSTILELQKIVKSLKKPRTVIKYRNIVTDTLIGKTDTIIFKDSLFPEYRGFSTTKGEWITSYVIANKDSIISVPRVKTSLTLTLSEEGKFLRRKKLVYNLTSHNPYTTQPSFSNVDFKDKRKKIKFKIRPGVTGGIDLQGRPNVVAGGTILIDW